IGTCAAGRAQESEKPYVSPVFGSNMVLQRKIPVPVWGWAQPDQKITVSIEGRSATATAGSDGKWMVKLAPQPVGSPYKMRIEGQQQTVTFDNILVGDVWVCSGQSNMEMGIGNVNNAETEIAQATNPNIRLFTVAKTVAYEPKTSLVKHDKELM